MPESERSLPGYLAAHYQSRRAGKAMMIAALHMAAVARGKRAKLLIRLKSLRVEA